MIFKNLSYRVSSTHKAYLISEWNLSVFFSIIICISFEFHVFNGILSHHYTPLNEFNVSLISLARGKRHAVESPFKSDPLDALLRISVFGGVGRKLITTICSAKLGIMPVQINWVSSISNHFTAIGIWWFSWWKKKLRIYQNFTRNP